MPRGLAKDQKPSKKRNKTLTYVSVSDIWIWTDLLLVPDEGPAL